MFSAEVAGTLLAAIREEEGEICGFLLEAPGDGSQRLVRCTNLAAQEGRVLVDESELAGIERLAEREHLVIKAFVHSQASGVRLGSAGRRSLARSRWPWLVVSASTGELEVGMYQGVSAPS